MHRDGRDKQLSDIATACPLDSKYGDASMEGGLAVFSALAQDNLACGLVMIRRISDHGHSQGDDYLRDECFSPYSAVVLVQELYRQSFNCKAVLF